MHLTAEQVHRYQTILTRLLEYTNERLHVVQQLSPQEERLLLDERMQLIGRELWRHLELVEGFTQDNPYELPKQHIEFVRNWRLGIPGVCIVVGYEENGNAIVEHDAGTFSVRGIAREISETLPPVPVAFKTALLPFEGSIVFGTPIDPIGRVNAVSVQKMRQKAKAAGFTGATISTAEELLMRSAAYEPLRAYETKLKVAEAKAAPAPVPLGYHRGPLAGYGVDERIAACDDRIFEILDMIGIDYGTSDLGAAETVSAHRSLFQAEHEALICAHVCAMLYGLLPLSDVYDQYSAMSISPLSRQHFYDLLIHQVQDALPNHGIWSHQGVRYVVAPSLTESAAHIKVMRSLQETTDGSELSLKSRKVQTCDEQDGVIVEHLTQREYLRIQESCIELLARRGKFPRRCIEQRMVERGMTRYLLDLEPVHQLVSFIGERIPDDQDDYLFPDSVIVQIISMFVTSHAQVGDAFELLKRMGMAECEGTSWSDTLGRMVVNVYNALPCWDMHGWSRTQITEHLTGRRTFYAANGTPLHIGKDNGCPCKSEKEFQRYRGCLHTGTVLCSPDGLQQSA